MRIEPAFSEDAPGLSSLIERYFPYTKANAENVRLRIDNSKYALFKAVEKNEMIGFLEVEYLDRLMGIMRLNGMAIKERYRGKGFGKKVLEFAIEYALNKNQAEMVLLVRPKNTIAKKLYQENGFEYLGIWKEKVDGEEVEEWQLKLLQ